MGQRPESKELETLIAFRGWDGGEDDQQQDQDDDQDLGGAGGADKDKDKSNDDKPDTVSREEFNSLMARMQAADRAKTAAEAKVKEFEDKDKSDLELAIGERDKYAQQVQELTERLDRQAIEMAFTSSEKYKWKNPSTALRLADLSEVTIEDGKVTGLDKALEKLAKSDPYLLAADEDEDDATKKQRTAPGGKPPAPDKNKAKREELLKRYPALRGRG